MSTRFENLNDVMSPNPSAVKIFGSIVVGASGAVASVRGKGFTATKLATAGQYSIEIHKPMTDIIAAHGSVMAAAPVARRVQPLSMDPVTRTVVLQVVDATPAAANPAEDAEVHFEITYVRTMAR